MFEQLPKRDFNVLGMGEVMLRLSPEGKERLAQSETFDKMAGGAEMNVAAGISQLGLRTGIITKLPDNEMGEFVKNKIRYTGISDDCIVYDHSPTKRLGVYYYESGAYPRVSVVVYDRANSSFTTFDASELKPKVYSSTNVFNISGITLALSASIRRNVSEMIDRFKEHDTLIAFDVNYRASLWDEQTAKHEILHLLPKVDILFVSEETLRRMFGQTGELTEIQRRFSDEFPNLKVIFSTRRTVTSPTRHTFTSLAYDCVEKRHFFEDPYRDIEVVDRIGSGDAYVAGALYGILQHHTIEQGVKFGNAMAAVKNTIAGDMTVCHRRDIERVIRAHDGSGDKSEMVR